MQYNLNSPALLTSLTWPHFPINYSWCPLQHQMSAPTRDSLNQRPRGARTWGCSCSKDRQSLECIYISHSSSRSTILLIQNRALVIACTSYTRVSHQNGCNHIYITFVLRVYIYVAVVRLAGCLLSTVFACQDGIFHRRT